MIRRLLFFGLSTTFRSKEVSLPDPLTVIDLFGGAPARRQVRHARVLANWLRVEVHELQDFGRHLIA